jgi:hypothetical protein
MLTQLSTIAQMSNTRLLMWLISPNGKAPEHGVGNDVKTVIEGTNYAQADSGGVQQCESGKS